MWRSLLLALLLIVPPFTHAATGDTGVFVPSVRSPIPDFTVVTGQPLHVNGYFYIPCTTYMGSTDPYAANFTVSPAVPGMGAMNALTGQWDGTPTTSAGPITIKCTTPTGSAQDTFNIAVQAGQVQLIAVGKFVDCSLGSGGSGTQAAPWGKLSLVTGMTASQDLWMKAGTTCTTSFSMGWSGTSGDHSRIGTYYVSGGTAYELWPDNPSAFPTDYTWSHGSRAIIRGTYNSTCSIKLNPALPAGTKCAHDGYAGTIPSQPAPGVPSDNYSGLIYVACDYCDIQNTRLLDSAGGGIVVGGTPNSATTFRRNEHRIINNEIGIAAWGSLQLQGTHNDFVYGNIVYRGGLGSARYGDDALGRNGDGGMLLGAFQQDVVGGATSIYNNINTLVEKNYIHSGTQENVIISQVGHVIWRGNRMGSGRAESFYNQTCGNCVYEYNVISGGNPFDHDQPARHGIGLVSESAFGILPETDLVIRGNMISNTNRCIHIGPQGGSVTAGIKINAKIYNNTCVDTVLGITIAGQNTPMTAANIGSKGVQIKNNIFYNEAGFVGEMCGSESQGAEIGVVWDYNFWQTLSTNAKCRGAHDTVGGNPLLTGSGFVAKSAFTTFPTPADYVLQAGSPALGKGTPLTATVITVDATEFPIRSNITYPCATFDTKGFIIDSDCRVVDPTPDNGAKGR